MEAIRQAVEHNQLSKVILASVAVFLAALADSTDLIAVGVIFRTS
jgi:hypothetical protein